jgi:hypothetical protein
MRQQQLEMDATNGMNVNHFFLQNRKALIGRSKKSFTEKDGNLRK